ncbi:MAG: MFS transporter, partial [Verrucomicrobia bacterium]|nr:MFS transporter [Verrucomicrobiota bacterium]
IALGHIYLAMHTDEVGFFVGLALIVVGSGLFSTNISALLGLFYEEDDPRREVGYTLFYVGINIGALLASILCGIIGELYGWHYGFGLAAFGMVAGNILFLSCTKLLEGKGEYRAKLSSFLLVFAVPLVAMMIAYEQYCMPLLFVVIVCYGLYKGLTSVLGLYLLALALFFAAEDQTASLLLVFSERHATEGIPVTTLLSINPFVIIVGGFILSRFKPAKAVSWFVSTGLLLAAAVFGMLSVACYFPNSESLVPIAVIAAAIGLISLGEVFLAPAIFSYCSEISPKNMLGATMGLIPLGFSLGNLLSGFLSKAIVADEGVSTLAQYGQGFGGVSLLLTLMAFFVILVHRVGKKIGSRI